MAQDEDPGDLVIADGPGYPISCSHSLCNRDDPYYIIGSHLTILLAQADDIEQWLGIRESIFLREHGRALPLIISTAPVVSSSRMMSAVQPHL